MYLEELIIRHFRCFNKAAFVFKSGLNILFGPNGSGKTSVLEALFFTCLTRSFKTQKDGEAIQWEKDHFTLKSKWTDFGSVTFSVVKNRGKKILLNNIPVEKFSEWIGRLPVIILSPEDAELAVGAPQLKRQYFDRLFSQVSQDYLVTLIRYTRLLKQKNAYLKFKNEKNSFVYDTQLETYEEQLAPLSWFIYNFRKEHFLTINEKLRGFFIQIDKRDISAQIEYKPSVFGENKDDYVRRYLMDSRKNIQRDIMLKRTLKGAGYDRLEFVRKDEPLKSGASQGEKKFWLVCMKLAEGEYFRKIAGKEPLFLFDDLLSELDIVHAKNLLDYITGLQQIIITSTDLSDIRRQGISLSSGSFNIIDI